MLRLRCFNLMWVVVFVGCDDTSSQPSSATGPVQSNASRPIPVAAVPVPGAVANRGAVPFDGVLFTGTIDAIGSIDDDRGATIAVGVSQNIRVVVSVDSVIQGDAPFESGDTVSFGVERWSHMCAGKQEEAIGRLFQFKLIKNESRFVWLFGTYAE